MVNYILWPSFWRNAVEIYGEEIPLQGGLKRKKYIEMLGFKVVRTATSFFFLGASWSKKDQTDRFIKDGI